jgi:hypothetical protein
MIEGLGCTEAALGCPIRSTMETVELGEKDHLKEIGGERSPEPRPEPLPTLLQTVYMAYSECFSYPLEPPG